MILENQTLSNQHVDQTPYYIASKPVIYLYPERLSIVHVSLKLSEKWKLSSIYPKDVKKKKSKLEDAFWKVIAQPDGSLKTVSDNKEYKYLFWEAVAHPRIFELNPKLSFCVAGSKIENFLETILEKYGMNEREQNDFIVYWLPHLKKNKWSLIQFFGTQEMEAVANLHIIPKPDVVIRIFMVFKESTRFRDDFVGQMPKESVKRDGFSVVEWGGMSLDNNFTFS